MAADCSMARIGALRVHCPTQHTTPTVDRLRNTIAIWLPHPCHTNGVCSRAFTLQCHRARMIARMCACVRVYVCARACARMPAVLYCSCWRLHNQHVSTRSRSSPAIGAPEYAAPSAAHPLNKHTHRYAVGHCCTGWAGAVAGFSGGPGMPVGSCMCMNMRARVGAWDAQ